MRQSTTVKHGKIVGFLILAGGALVALYDVDWVFSVRMPTEARVPDPAIEADYRRCYDDKDHEIHALAFATIDNPEVQKEYITSNRLRAAAECRAAYPQKSITVQEPLRVDLFDVESRFW